MKPWRPISVLALLGGLAVSQASAAPPCREVITFAEGNVPSREVFIAPSGNDSTGDGTETRPYRSLDHAARDLTPGAALRLLPGTYAGGTFLSDLAGTAQAPLWIGGVPGRKKPLISGGSTALQLSRVRYLVVEHLEIADAATNGINCDDGGDYDNPDATRFLLFRNLEIHDIGTGGNQDCVKLSGLNDYWVVDCVFRNGSAGGSGIDQVGCHRGVIARCSFTAMGSNAIQCKGGSEDITIQWSRFRDAGARAVNIGGSTGFEFFRPPLSASRPNVEARNIRVLANVFQGSDAPVAFVGSTDCLVAHNTLVDPNRWIARILQETATSGEFVFAPCGRSRLVNNLVYFSRGNLSTFVNVGPDTDPSSFTFANNLWYAHDNPALSTPHLPVAESDPQVGLDPQLGNPAQGDFTVPLDSPAVARGTPLPEAPADLFQQCFANPPTIGACETLPAAPRHSDNDAIPDWWEDRFGLNPLDAGDAAHDNDGDGAGNAEEYLAGTDPSDGSSTLRLRRLERSPGDTRIGVPTSPTRVYLLEATPVLTLSAWAKTEPFAGDGSLREIPLDRPQPLENSFVRIRSEFPASRTTLDP